MRAQFPPSTSPKQSYVEYSDDPPRWWWTTAGDLEVAQRDRSRPRWADRGNDPAPGL